MKLKQIAFSLFFIACFSAKLVSALHHAFEAHNIELCSLNDVEHICDHVSKDNIDYYHQLNFHTTDTYQTINTTSINSVDILKQSFLTNHQQLSFSLRGPPVTV